MEKPARYVGGEWGQVKKNWDTTPIRVCLAFPDIFDIGMSHLGTRILYNNLNAPPDILCERAFVPWTDMEQTLRKLQLHILSLENAKPLKDFHIVGISLQHELVFTNALTLLDLGGIPLRTEARDDTDPLVLGGGSIASHPEPIAPFFDAFVLGDGEQKAVEVARSWTNDLNRGVERTQRLRNLAALGGVYVPSLYSRKLDDQSKRMIVDSASTQDIPNPVERAFLSQLEQFPTSFPVGGPEAVFDRLSVEIARGCSQGCRFCQGGMIFRPERERTIDSIVNTIQQALKLGGQDDLSLTSLSPADYSAIGPLVQRITEQPELEHVVLNVSSLRAYGLDTKTLDEIRRVRVSNLTFAPEAGTQRLRDLINKNITEEQLLATTERVVQRGWERIKLYFMIGLPTETPEDVDAIIDLTARVRSVAKGVRRGGRPVQVTASVSTFVPKPHTPLQWAQMIDLESVKEKHRRLTERARERKVDIKTHDPSGSVLEGILSRADHRLAPIIEEAWRAGARFDAWDGNVRLKTWTDAMARHDLAVAEHLEQIPIDAHLPWGHLSMGVHQAFLRREWDRALRPDSALRTLPCLRPVDNASGSKKLVCNQCGLVCDLDRNPDRDLDGDTERDPEQAVRSPDNTRETRPPHESKSHASKSKGRPTISVSYRLRYEKLGRASLLGHLDLVREMPRILRRAGLPLAYSQGFHPMAIMGFGPALQLGVPSFEEYVDIKTNHPVDKHLCISKINSVCPVGIAFTAMSDLPPKSTPVVNAVSETDILLGISAEEVEVRGGQDWLKDRVAWVVESKELIVRRNSKGKDRTLDVRPLIIEMRLAGAEDSASMACAGIPGKWSIIRMRSSVTPNGSVRIDEVVSLICDGNLPEHRAVRLTLRGAAGTSVMGESVD